MGILAMIAGLTLLIVVHEFGHWIVARMLGFQTPIFSIGFGKPYIVLGRRWGTEFRLTPWLLGGYVALPEMGDESTAKEFMKANGLETGQYEHKQFAIWKRSAVAVAGVTMNVIAAIVITFGLLAFVGKPHYEVKDVFIGELSATNTIARDAGLKPNDVIVAVDGQPVSKPEDLVRLIGSHKGTEALITVQRPGESAPLTIPVTPDADGKIGIAIGVHQELEFEQVGVGEAAGTSVSYSFALAKEMVRGIGMMVGLVDKPQGLPEGATDVHGVIAIVQLGAAAFDAGFYVFLDMLVRISMMLAVMNILPIPVLDGGYLMFYAIEKIRGKPLDRDLELRIKSVFMMLLLMLMVYAIFNDVFNPIRLK